MEKETIPSVSYWNNPRNVLSNALEGRLGEVKVRLAAPPPGGQKLVPVTTMDPGRRRFGRTAFGELLKCSRQRSIFHKETSLKVARAVELEHRLSTTPPRHLTTPQTIPCAFLIAENSQSALHSNPYLFLAPLSIASPRPSDHNEHRFVDNGRLFRPEDLSQVPDMTLNARNALRHRPDFRGF
ncbi:hypothetical protein MRB53_021911 [Persea americana]|uniref:Uncharacterized protein n=1 Tax=Persea americana TaxID=3435 RepID=A0ACC2L6B4_PERAE|nr:hypothetical protein MRB53_021911 [Persea americana]